MRSAIALLFVVLFVTGNAVTGAKADQTDQKLDELFQRLQRVSGAQAAHPIETEIWSIWTHNGNSDVDHRMAVGILKMKRGELDASFAAFDKVVELAPTFAEGWNKRATIHYLMGDFDESVRDIQRTLALEPRHFGALSGIGLIFEAIGNDAAAIRAWERALKIHPNLTGIRARMRSLKETLTGKPI